MVLPLLGTAFLISGSVFLRIGQKEKEKGNFESAEWKYWFSGFCFMASMWLFWISFLAPHV